MLAWRSQLCITFRRINCTHDMQCQSPCLILADDGCWVARGVRRLDRWRNHQSSPAQGERMVARFEPCLLGTWYYKCRFKGRCWLSMTNIIKKQHFHILLISSSITPVGNVFKASRYCILLIWKIPNRMAEAQEWNYRAADERLHIWLMMRDKRIIRTKSPANKG